MPTIEETILFATRHHSGQTDKAGLPYILHPLRVMSRFVGDDEDELRTIAMLHDIVEDTDVTLERLRERGYSAAVVDAIDALTRRKGETYKDYIDRVALNALAVRVKIADLEDNLDPRRTSTEKLNPLTLNRYISAKNYLVSVRRGAAVQQVSL